jgi:hypothetical protein
MKNDYYEITSVLCFSGCDINSPRQAGLNGETPDICKTLESPLHLGKFSLCFFLLLFVIFLSACQWGLERVVSTLIEHHADINKKVSYLNIFPSELIRFILGYRRQYTTSCCHY